MTENLTQFVEGGKMRIVECEKKFNSASINYPVIQGQNLISKGKKLPFKLTKKSAIASIVFGVSIYYELFEKSIPIKRFTQTLNASCQNEIDYFRLIQNIQCEQIGKCDTYNKAPHK